MLTALPGDPAALMEWTWPDFEPYYRELESRHLTADSLPRFMSDWTSLTSRVDELHQRLYVGSTQNTADDEVEQRYRSFLDEIYPESQAAEQRLKEKLLDSGLKPADFDLQWRDMEAEVALFREANLPLLSEEQKLAEEFNKIVGAQTVEWEGQEIPLLQLIPVLQDNDRARRERAWRLAAERRLRDKEAIDGVWGQLLQLRLQMARNAGFEDYRSFRWRQMLRFDYTPEDSLQFHRAIEEVVVPAVKRILDRRRERLGVETLRPWDLEVDPLGRPPLRPYEQIEELTGKVGTMFHRVDPQLGSYFDVMRQDDLLDLENRKNKAPGGYCTHFAVAGRPFIFMNGVGIHQDVETLLHEGGHAFHFMEAMRLPYHQQWFPGLEFLEVASMSMELLAAPYLPVAEGGFYSEADAARARLQHLERCLRLWCSIAMIDAIQHWMYQNPDDAADPSTCDAQWARLRERFMPGVDWTGLEQELTTERRRIPHIYEVPFYYIEYGMAQLGAVQIWANALRDQAEAVGRYRQALGLGATRSLPELYGVAGAKFAFDAATLRKAVELMEQTIGQLDDHDRAA